MQNGDSLRNLADECHVMLGDQHRHALRIERLDQFTGLESLFGKHASGRLVQADTREWVKKGKTVEDLLREFGRI